MSTPKMSDLDDRELVSLVLSKNERATTELVERYTPVMWRMISKVLSKADEDTVDEVVQLAFIRALNALPRFGFASKLSTWICSIARNLAIDYARDAERHGAIDAEYLRRYGTETFAPGKKKAMRAKLSGGLPSLPSGLEHWHMDAYNAAVEGLSEMDRGVWNMSVSGASARDIGNAIGLSEGGVRIKLMRVRNKLTEMIRDYRPPADENPPKRISRTRAKAIVNAMVRFSRGL
jgi:RNA polymerase sigma-70 factor (ECF subfamily)